MRDPSVLSRNPMERAFGIFSFFSWLWSAFDFSSQEGAGLISDG